MTSANVQLLHLVSPGVLRDCSFKRSCLILYKGHGGGPGIQDAGGEEVLYCSKTHCWSLVFEPAPETVRTFAGNMTKRTIVIVIE